MTTATPKIAPTRITCPRCDAAWTGLATAHCSACHRTFTTVSAFDKHRDGSHSRGTRHCVDPETVGLVQAARPYPCWAHPGSNPRFTKPVALREIAETEQPQ